MNYNIPTHLRRIEAKLDTILEFLNKSTTDVKTKVDDKEKPVSTNDNNTVYVQDYGKGFLVNGNTRGIRNTLRENGGRWNPTLKGWVFPPRHKEEVIEALQEDIDIDVVLK